GDPSLPQVRAGDRPTVTERNSRDRDLDEALVRNPNLPDVTRKPQTTDTTTAQGDNVTQTSGTGETVTRTEYSLVPTDPHPPSLNKNAVITFPENTDSLARRMYYLQLGVYKTRDEADRVMRANPTYPMEIVTAQVGSATVYKVVVGPLKRDESGTVLYLFKANGYRDAFIRYME
ncbi:MAG: SPOR domain-containing protein, partial [Spirochaetaceae bacterium]